MFTGKSHVNVGTGKSQGIDPAGFTRALVAHQAAGRIKAFRHDENRGWFIEFCNGQTAWVDTAREAWFVSAALASADYGTAERMK